QPLTYACAVPVEKGPTFPDHKAPFLVLLMKCILIFKRLRSRAFPNADASRQTFVQMSRKRHLAVSSDSPMPKCFRTDAFAQTSDKSPACIQGVLRMSSRRQLFSGALDFRME